MILLIATQFTLLILKIISIQKQIMKMLLVAAYDPSYNRKYVNVIVESFW
jgi:hypothetical protein